MKQDAEGVAFAAAGGSLSGAANGRERQWRVGTWSMGIALLAAGCSLLAQSLGAEKDAWLPLSLWWPVLFIVLGGEILAFLALQKRQAPLLKFDGLSILLIGLIGTVGLGMAAFEQSGALDEFRHFLRSEERLLEAPALREEVGADVQRIVIRTDKDVYWPIYADAVDARELSVSASVRASLLPGERDPEWLASLLSQERVGNTLYVTVRRPPASNGLNESPSRLDVRVVAPKDVKVEFHTLAHELELRNKPEKWEVVAVR